VSDYRLGARLLVASRGLVFYLWKLIWPAWLSPFYPLQSTIELRNMEFSVPVAICVVLTIVAVWQRKRVPLLAATWWSYVVVLLPVSGLIQVGGQAVADRYAYLAMVPVLIALTSVGLWIWRRCSTITKILLWAFLSVWLAFLGLQTRRQIPAWHDGLSLWSAVLARFPNDPRANSNLATALVGLGRLSEARPYAERAVYFSDPQTPQLPLARATLGTIYLKAHLYEAAANQLQLAIAADGSLSATRYNLACAYARLGRLSEAYFALQKLFAVHPEFAALAARDGELATLRNDPRFAAPFAELIGTAKVDGKF
jgi:protein O-mannosyl-transferase